MNNLTTLDIIFRIIEAAALGGLTGLERESIFLHHEKKIGKTSSQVFGGFRSFMLLSVLGSLSIYIGNILGSPLLCMFLVGGSLFLLLLCSYVYSSFHQGHMGVTSEYSAILIFFVGALVMLGEVQIAIFLGIFVTVLLNYKTQLVYFIKKLGENEINTTLKFAVIVLVMLPLFPDHKYAIHDLWGAIPETTFTLTPYINPYSIWFFVVIMSSVSYIGYILSKIMNANNGIVLSGIIGGIVSSTAVTTAMSEKSKTDEGRWVFATVLATITACTIMLIRVMAIIFVINPSLLSIMIYPLFAMLWTSAFCLWWCHDKESMAQKIDMTGTHVSPFRIGPALKFAGLVLLIKTFSALALSFKDYFGDFSLYLVSLFSGIADVDIITQDMAERSRTGLASVSYFTASIAIMITVTANTFTKISIAKRFGHPLFGKLVLRILSIVLVVGVLVLGGVSWWG